MFANIRNYFWNLLIIRCYVHKNLIITSNNGEEEIPEINLQTIFFSNEFLIPIFLSLHMKSQDSGFQVRDKECPQGPKVTLDSLSLKYLEPE